MKLFLAARRRISCLLPHWPWVLTLLVLGFAIYSWNTSDNITELNALGGFLSGVVAAITLIWLALGQHYQLKELALQREELTFQRRATEQQAKELSNASRIAALSQVQAQIQQARAVLNEEGVPIGSEGDLLAYFVTAMDSWSIVENSVDPREVTNAYKESLKVESVCKRYISYISEGLRIYVEYYYPDNPIPREKSPVETVIKYSTWGENAPHISASIGPARALSEMVILVEPQFERMRLASFVAHTMLIESQIMKEGALEDLRDKVLLNSDSLPAICSIYPPWIDQND